MDKPKPKLALKFLNGNYLGPYSFFDYRPFIKNHRWTPKIKGTIHPCETGYHLPVIDVFLHWSEAKLFLIERTIIEDGDGTKSIVRQIRFRREIKRWNRKNVVQITKKFMRTLSLTNQDRKFLSDFFEMYQGNMSQDHYRDIHLSPAKNFADDLFSIRDSYWWDLPYLVLEVYGTEYDQNTATLSPLKLQLNEFFLREFVPILLKEETNGEN